MADDYPGFHEGDPTVLTFTTKEKKRPWQQVSLDGHPVMVREPKGAWFLGLAQISADDDQAQADAVARMIDKVFDKDSATHVRERMNDDDDDFDVDELGEVFDKLREVWTKSRRPTGRAAGSRGTRRRGGSRSAAT